MLCKSDLSFKNQLSLFLTSLTSLCCLTKYSSYIMSGVASAAEVADTLHQLASRLAVDGHPMQAIKCYVAMLSQSMLPSDEAAARLRLGQLLMQHTLNMQDAKQHLQQAVCACVQTSHSFCFVLCPPADSMALIVLLLLLLQEMLVMPLPGQHLLKCEVLAGLAAAHQVLGEVDFQRRCYNKGLEQCKDKTANSADKCVAPPPCLMLAANWPPPSTDCRVVMPDHPSAVSFVL